MYPSKESIEKAHQNIKPYIHHTVVLSNAYLNSLSQAEIYFKCENFQKIGAFKARGGLNAALNLSKEELSNGICTHSSGNHAQAVAYAAKILNTKAYIVMPNTAPSVKINAVKEYGAEVIFCEPNQKAREETVAALVVKTGATFIHPYNNHRVIEGQATAAKELLEQNTDLDILITPVGGGGLLSGTCLAAYYFAPSVTVYAAEPELVNDAYLSVLHNKIMPQTGHISLADGLLTSLGDLTFPIIQKHVREILTVTEDEITTAMRLLWERLKIVVEASSAVPLAAILKNPSIFSGKKIGVILSGGNVDLQKLPF